MFALGIASRIFRMYPVGSETGRCVSQAVPVPGKTATGFPGPQSALVNGEPSNLTVPNTLKQVSWPVYAGGLVAVPGLNWGRRGFPWKSTVAIVGLVPVN